MFIVVTHVFDAFDASRINAKKLSSVQIKLDVFCAQDPDLKMQAQRVHSYLLYVRLCSEVESLCVRLVQVAKVRRVGVAKPVSQLFENGAIVSQF